MNGASGDSAVIRVRQVRSGIGFNRSQKATLSAMGLGRIGKARTMPDNPQTRGMIAKVSHLVVVDETTDG